MKQIQFKIWILQDACFGDKLSSYQKRFGGFYHRGCVHAETDALIPLIKDNVDLTNASIYIFRAHKNGSNALARPCPGCESLIRACGIKKVYYTTENSYTKEVML